MRGLKMNADGPFKPIELYGPFTVAVWDQSFCLHRMGAMMFGAMLLFTVDAYRERPREEGHLVSGRSPRPARTRGAHAAQGAGRRNIRALARTALGVLHAAGCRGHGLLAPRA